MAIDLFVGLLSIVITAVVLAMVIVYLDKKLESKADENRRKLDLEDV